MNTFAPSISYWKGHGTGIRETGIPNPETALAKTSLLLLVHGYNNDQDDASKSYQRFVGLQQLEGTIRANIVGVYWPGANWTGAAYYMQAISQAKKVAPRLAKDLVSAAGAMGILRIDIVAHSLGCRLVLEMVKELLELKKHDPVLSGLVFDKVVFMAGAVPTHYLEDLGKLGSSLAHLGGSMSIYSEDDAVLKYAFPLGQSLAGERLFPVALGRKRWVKAGRLPKPIQQVENTDAGHSDYWGGDEKRLKQKAKAAEIVRGFIPIVSSVARTVSVSRLPSIRRPEIREGAVRRVVGGRG